jgi:hypothetical protein
MKTNDPLLDSIDQTLDREKGQAYRRAKAKSETRVQRMNEDLNAFHRFALQVGVACVWIWSHILRPLWHAATWVFRKLFRQYRKLWSLVVYRRDEFENLRLSKTRAGLFLTGTLVSLFFLFELIGFGFDGTMYAATGHHNEVMYLTSSQEVDAPGNVHAVKGCDALPCSDTDSVYFRVTPSAFNHVWSLIHSHTLFFPDYVSAAVPPGLNRCVISSYGVRVKLLMRGFDIYPELLKASCTPVTTSLHDHAPAQPAILPVERKE